MFLIIWFAVVLSILIAIVQQLIRGIGWLFRAEDPNRTPEIFDAVRPKQRVEPFLGKSRAVVVAVLLVATTSAHAQTLSGFIRPLRPATSIDLPSIMLPKPEWAKMEDLQDSDGTVEVPPCSDPAVIFLTYQSLLDVMNRKAGSVTNFAFVMFSKLSLSPIWVHETISGRQTCSVEAQASMGSDSAEPLAKERWVFQTFARDGKGMLFFADTQPNSY